MQQKTMSEKNIVIWRFQPSTFAFRILCTFVIVSMISGCRSPEKYKAQADKEVYNIIENKWQDGFGQKTNYKISNADPNEARPVKFIPPEKTEVVGASGKDVWKFKTLKKGTTTISMDYSRSWEGGEKEEWTFKATINIK